MGKFQIAPSRCIVFFQGGCLWEICDLPWRGGFLEPSIYEVVPPELDVDLSAIGNPTDSEALFRESWIGG